MTRNQTHDDASSSITTIKTCDNNIGVVPWSDLTHDVLFLVMMQIGVIDYLAFGGVCKSWRSVAVSNRSKFMASKSPMSICISTTNANEKECHLKDFEGRKFKTIIPHSTDKTCVGLTCGYLILICEKSDDYWLVNPITRHELHFPHVPFAVRCYKDVNAILVFSPSVSGWVFVISDPFYRKIRFSVAGKGEWTHFTTQTETRLFRIRDLHVFKGKIYVPDDTNHLSEVTLFPIPKVKFLKIENFQVSRFKCPVLVSSGENLYVMDRFFITAYKIINSSSKVDWVSLEKIECDFALYFCKSKQCASIISDNPLQYGRCAVTDKGSRGMIYYAKMWYPFHDCLNVHLFVE